MVGEASEKRTASRTNSMLGRGTSQIGSLVDSCAPLIPWSPTPWAGRGPGDSQCLV
jgi:hypothetical protein